MTCWYGGALVQVAGKSHLLRQAAMSIEALASLHTRLFMNCLEGMDDAMAARRIDDRTNSAGFVAAHLVDARAWTGRMLGLDLPAPFGGTVAYGRAMDDLAEIPALGAIREEWGAVSILLESRVTALTPAELATSVSQRFPIEDPTLGGALSFLMHHEAYHIGQLALLRRVAGLAAMRYEAGS
jgi:uncharacterized damage-inducible protein DinB